VTRTAKKMLALGGLSAKSRSLPHFIANGEDFSDIAHRVCNASMSNMSAEEARRLLPAAPHRSGSMDFKRYPSRGVSDVEPIITREQIARQADEAAQATARTKQIAPNPYPPGSDAGAAWKASFERQFRT